MIVQSSPSETQIVVKSFFTKSEISTIILFMNLARSLLANKEKCQAHGKTSMVKVPWYNKPITYVDSQKFLLYSYEIFVRKEKKQKFI